jgi:RNA recognition motif-containing protein
VEKVEVTSPKIYVGNLSYEATESDLFDVFNGVGTVQDAEIVSDAETYRSKGFGFVTMARVEEAKRAVDTLHDKDFMGRRMVVTGVKSEQQSV